MPSAAIIGTGHFAPEKVITNADLEKMVDTNDEWITQRTGIKQRHVIVDGECASMLAVNAANAAMKDAGVSPDDIDLVICGTCTPDMPLPSVACIIQDKLGMKDTPAFDLAAACSGFVYALSVGSSFIRAGAYKRVLVIAVDCLSRYTDYTDRGSCILFGDAAGAVVLEACEDESKGIQYFNLGADGSGWDLIHIPAGGSQKPATAQTVADGEHYIKMRGRDVYKFAVGRMTYLLEDCMEKCNLTVDDVDAVVPHQVNMRIIESATGKVKFPLDKVYVNIDRFGNTSAASAAVALDEARKRGVIQEGSTIVMAAFGAGLTWAGAVVKF